MLGLSGEKPDWGRLALALGGLAGVAVLVVLHWIGATGQDFLAAADVPAATATAPPLADRVGKLEDVLVTAAEIIERQNARLAALEAKVDRLEAAAVAASLALQGRIAALESARMAAAASAPAPRKANARKRGQSDPPARSYPQLPGAAQ